MSENVRKLIGVAAMAALVVVGVVTTSGDDDDFTRNGVFAKLDGFRQLPEAEQARAGNSFMQQAAPKSLDTGPINKINSEVGPIGKGAKASIGITVTVEDTGLTGAGKASVLEGRGVDGKGGTSSLAHAGTASPSYPVLSGRKASIVGATGANGVADRIEKCGYVTSAGNDEIATANSLKNVLVASYMENTKDLHSWGCAGDITWAIKESEQLSNFGKDEAGLLAACMESRVGDVLLKSHTEAMAADCVATVMPALSPERAKRLGTYWQTPEQLDRIGSEHCWPCE
jgi:hypothetical protein